jgi:hypothetical protein
VYEKCAFEPDSSLGTLMMLSNIEAKLEEYLSSIEKMPQEEVEKAEKEKEKERRWVFRPGNGVMKRRLLHHCRQVPNPRVPTQKPRA